MKAKYKIYPEQNLLVEIFYGDIDMNALQLIVKEQMKNPDFPKVKKTISDVRQANMQISNSELDSYVENLKAYLDDMQIIWGILTDNPNETALSLLLKNDDFFLNKVEVFSTLSSLTRFLSVNFSEEDLLRKDYLPIHSNP